MLLARTFYAQNEAAMLVAYACTLFLLNMLEHMPLALMLFLMFKKAGNANNHAGIMGLTLAMQGAVPLGRNPFMLVLAWISYVRTYICPALVSVRQLSTFFFSFFPRILWAKVFVGLAISCERAGSVLLLLLSSAAVSPMCPSVRYYRVGAARQISSL